MRLCIVGSQFDGALVVRDGLLRTALAVGEITEAVVGLGPFRLGLDHCLKARHRLLVFLGIPERHAQVIAGIGKGRIEPQALAVGGDGLGELALVIGLGPVLKMEGRGSGQLLGGRQLDQGEGLVGEDVGMRQALVVPLQ